MELVCINYLSLEPSKGGVENVLVITDHFTHLAHAVPTRTQTVKTTAETLYKFFLFYYMVFQNVFIQTTEEIFFHPPSKNFVHLRG